MKILLLEDVEEDAELALYHIRKDGIDHEHHRVDNLSDFKLQLEHFNPDVILSDYNLPACTAIDAFEVLEESIPFIILSGAIGEEKAVEALKKGVTDYVSKDSLSRLSHVLNRAIDEQKMRKEKQEAEEQLLENKERLELALTGAELGTWDWDLKTNLVVCNNRALQLLAQDDQPEHGVPMKLIYDRISPESLENSMRALREHYQGNSPFFECGLRIDHGDDQWKWVMVKGKIVRSSDYAGQLRATGTLQDINEMKIQQEKLQRSQERLREAYELARIGSFEWTLQNGFSYASQAFRDIYEVKDKHLKEHRDFYYKHVHPEDKDYVFSVFLKQQAGKQNFDLEHRIITSQQNEKVIKSRGQLFYDEKGLIVRVVGTVLDITEQIETKKALYRGQELERQRVAREIHDGIGQMLIATKYKVAAVEQDEGFAKSIEEVEDLLVNIIDETRRIARNLSSRMIEESGLEKALKILIKELSTISTLKIEGKFENITNLSNEVSVAIYRIVQEGVNNAIKHAKATEMTIALKKEKRILYLQMVDNGQGFNLDGLRQSSGSGIKNMEERVAVLNGHFEIKSMNDQGTEIYFWIPLSSA